MIKTRNRGLVREVFSLALVRRNSAMDSWQLVSREEKQASSSLNNFLFFLGGQGGMGFVV